MFEILDPESQCPTLNAQCYAPCLNPNASTFDPQNLNGSTAQLFTTSTLAPQHGQVAEPVLTGSNRRDFRRPHFWGMGHKLRLFQSLDTRVLNDGKG